MKITASVTKSLHQDRGLCYLNLLIFFLYMHSPVLLEIKRCCDRCLSQQIRPQIFVQLYILRDYSNVRIGFNMINKRHAVRIVHHVSLILLSFDHCCLTQC